MPDLRMRVLQPPHGSDHFTLDEAIAAWRKVEAGKRARAARKGRRAVVDAPPRDPSLRPGRSSVDPEP